MRSLEPTILFDGPEVGGLTAWSQALSQRNCSLRRAAANTSLAQQVKAQKPRLLLLHENILRQSMQVLSDVRQARPEMAVMLVSASFDSLSRFDFEAVAQQALAKGVSEVIAGDSPTWLVMDRFLKHVRPQPAAETRLDVTEPPLPSVPMPELYDESGRVSAVNVANYLHIPLTELSEGLGKKYRAVHKTPDAKDLQPLLADIVTTIELLRKHLGDDPKVRAWLNRPHPDLSNTSPLQLILKGRAQTVRFMVEDALNGYPS